MKMIETAFLSTYTFFKLLRGVTDVRGGTRGSSCRKDIMSLKGGGKHFLRKVHALASKFFLFQGRKESILLEGGYFFRQSFVFFSIEGSSPSLGEKIIKTFKKRHIFSGYSHNRILLSAKDLRGPFGISGLPAQIRLGIHGTDIGKEILSQGIFALDLLVVQENVVKILEHQPIFSRRARQNTSEEKSLLLRLGTEKSGFLLPERKIEIYPRKTFVTKAPESTPELPLRILPVTGKPDISAFMLHIRRHLKLRTPLETILVLPSSAELRNLQGHSKMCIDPAEYLLMLRRQDETPGGGRRIQKTE